MNAIKKALMERDGMTEAQAEAAIKTARDDLNDRLALGEDAHDICEEHFGLEPDYLLDLIG